MNNLIAAAITLARAARSAVERHPSEEAMETLEAALEVFNDVAIAEAELPTPAIRVGRMIDELEEMLAEAATNKDFEAVISYATALDTLQRTRHAVLGRPATPR